MNRFAAILGALALAGMSSGASAAVFTEDFEAPFPTWEAGWFGTNSDAENYFCDRGPTCTSRNNNPDGLWLQSVNGPNTAGSIFVNFNATFAASLTSFFLDVAGVGRPTLRIYDKDGNTLLAQEVPSTDPTSDPAVYTRFGVTSNNGIGSFSFVGNANSTPAGNISIDNLEAIARDSGAIPEPTTWALMIGGFGLAGAALRRQRAAAVAA